MGGFFYWVCGHAFAYGNNPTYATPFNGFGGFFFDADEREHFAGIAYLHFFYQMGNSFGKYVPKNNNFIINAFRFMFFGNFYIIGSNARKSKF